MTLRQLESFHLVATEGGFAAATGKPPLGLSRAALFTQVASLQSSLGTRLYTVHAKRILLTEAGHALNREIEGLLARLRTLPALIAAEGSGAVSAALTPLVSHAITPTLRRYQAAHPDVRLSFFERRPAEVWDQIIHARVDFAVAPPPPSAAGVIVRKVCEDPAVLICSPNHRLARRRKPSLEDVARESLVTYVPATAQRQRLDSAFAAAGLTPHIVVEASTPALIQRLAALGLGVGVTSALGVEVTSRARVKVIGAAHLFEAVDVDILVHPSQHLSPAARDLIDHVARHLARRGGR